MLPIALFKDNVIYVDLSSVFIVYFWWTFDLLQLTSLNINRIIYNPGRRNNLDLLVDIVLTCLPSVVKRVCSALKYF